MIGTYVELRDQALRVENALRQVLERQEVWHCNRVWEAWAVDTMSRDDFSLVTEDPVAIEELVQAVMSVSGAATVSSAATEALVRKQQRYIEELERVDGVGLSERVEMLEAERDAALAALERVRAIHYEDDHECAECSFEPMPDVGFRGVSVPWPCPTLAALDGAPEPEWEVQYGRRNRETGALHWLTGDQRDDWWHENQDRYEHVKRYTSPPLPVEGESK